MDKEELMEMLSRTQDRCLHAQSKWQKYMELASNRFDEIVKLKTQLGIAERYIQEIALDDQCHPCDARVAKAILEKIRGVK